MHVTADSFAVKSLHCERAPREAMPNQGRENVPQKGGMCNYFICGLGIKKNPHQTTAHDLWSRLGVCVVIRENSLFMLDNGPFFSFFLLCRHGSIKNDAFPSPVLPHREIQNPS